MKKQFSKKKYKNSPKTFHTPQTYGELIKIPMTFPMQLISICSILLQVILTIFSVYAFFAQSYIVALEGSGFSSSIIYLIFPIVTWLLSFGFRFGCRAIPFDMWRLPVKVREGVKLSHGTLLKLITLLVELETALCLLYICIVLYLGFQPSNLILVIWIILLVFSVYLPGKKAADVAK